MAFAQSSSNSPIQKSTLTVEERRDILLRLHELRAAREKIELLEFYIGKDEEADEKIEATHKQELDILQREIAVLEKELGLAEQERDLYRTAYEKSKAKRKWYCLWMCKR